MKKLVIDKEQLKKTLQNPPIYLKMTALNLKYLLTLIELLPTYEVDEKNMKRKKIDEM